MDWGVSMGHSQDMWKVTFWTYGWLNRKMLFTYIRRWGEERTQKRRLIRKASETLLFRVKIRFNNTKSLYYEDILYRWKYQPIAWVDTTYFTPTVIVGKCVVKDVYTTFKGKYLGYSLIIDEWNWLLHPKHTLGLAFCWWITPNLYSFMYWSPW
jgi:hypothetical protein